MPPVWTFTAAAEVFGVSIPTVSEIVRAHRIDTKPVPHNGKARGLTKQDMRIVARALNRRFEPPEVVAAE